MFKNHRHLELSQNTLQNTETYQNKLGKLKGNQHLIDG